MLRRLKFNNNHRRFGYSTSAETRAILEQNRPDLSVPAGPERVMILFYHEGQCEVSALENAQIDITTKFKEIRSNCRIKSVSWAKRR